MIQHCIAKFGSLQLLCWTRLKVSCSMPSPPTSTLFTNKHLDKGISLCNPYQWWFFTPNILLLWLRLMNVNIGKSILVNVITLSLHCLLSRDHLDVSSQPTYESTACVLGFPKVAFLPLVRGEGGCKTYLNHSIIPSSTLFGEGFIIFGTWALNDTKHLHKWHIS